MEFRYHFRGGSWGVYGLDFCSCYADTENIYFIIQEMVESGNQRKSGSNILEVYIE